MLDSTTDGVPIARAPGSRVRIALGAAVVLVLIAFGSAVLAAVLAPGSPGVEVVGGAAPGSDATNGRSPGSAVGTPAIVVHVLGAVASPGIYELPVGSRVIDAIASAGGFTTQADRGGVNLARLVTDAEQILVPVIGAAVAESGTGLVNLNTADAAALQTLPRVGPAMADRIIAWREANGGFRAVDDLLSVSGIGEKTFEGLRALVTV